MKSKVLFSTGVFGILLMMAGQLSFSINDSFVKLAVKEISLNSSIFSVIFTRGLITTSLLAIYLVIIEKKNSAIIFTQDTGPTERIWELGKNVKNLKAIFTEISFPNKLQKIAEDSQHHTPASLNREIEKMPGTVPIFVGHLKPNYQDELYQEIDLLGNERISVMGDDDTSYIF